MLFSLRMVVLLHKWQFKNIEVEFLKVSEKIWSPELPDIGARKSWDLLILTSVQALYTLSRKPWFLNFLMKSSSSPKPRFLGFLMFLSYFWCKVKLLWVNVHQSFWQLAYSNRSNWGSSLIRVYTVCHTTRYFKKQLHKKKNLGQKYKK